MSNYAPAVEAATKVIEFIAENSTDVGISEICRGTGMNKNMAFRILNSLEKQGWVYAREQKYGLTLVPFRIFSKALSKITLNNVAMPIICKLWKKTGESTYLGIAAGNKVLYIQHLDGIGDVRISGRVGGEYDLHCTAPGKVLLAFAEEEFINTYLNNALEKHTEKTITDKDALRKELDNIRIMGYATDKEEFGNGIACAAAPIYDYSSHVIGTVGCSACILNSNAENVTKSLLPHILEAAGEISCCLGGEKQTMCTV